jgi:hypothetical protein
MMSICYGGLTSRKSRLEGHKKLKQKEKDLYELLGIILYIVPTQGLVFYDPALPLTGKIEHLTVCVVQGKISDQLKFISFKNAIEEIKSRWIELAHHYEKIGPSLYKAIEIFNKLEMHDEVRRLLN